MKFSGGTSQSGANCMPITTAVSTSGEHQQYSEYLTKRTVWLLFGAADRMRLSMGDGQSEVRKSKITNLVWGGEVYNASMRRLETG